MAGKVTLIGAGPGDPGLITIKGIRALESAEVVVYDRLVGPELLSRANPEAELIYVGKASSNHPVPQGQINKILLDKALEGKNVARLKGGDPFVFGRGGEELQGLLDADIAFEVVPGVTSAVAAAAYGGIPVTHRDFCSSLHIITGHARENRAPEINFSALTGTGGTLVFLMGVTALGYICGGLLDAGMSPDTPAAVIQNGTLPSQRRVMGTVSTLEARARENGIKSPALIVVGRVCGLSEDLNWFERLPLFGRRIAVTRPRERIGTLSERLRSLGAEVLEYPCIETLEIPDNPALDEVMNRFSKYEWLCFTSPAGVRHLMDRLFRSGRDVRSLGCAGLAVIGPGTAAELKKHSLLADLMPEAYNAENLGQVLAERARGSVLILRAREGSPELTRQLDRENIKYDDVPVYETVYRSQAEAELRERLIRDELDAVTFTSASTVRGFTESLGGNVPLGIKAICIGEQTEKAARDAGFSTCTARAATIDELVSTTIECLKGEGK